MRKKVVCIFAHPDDEAFGPSGTIAKLSLDHDVYLICATSGEHGQNPENIDLAQARRADLQKSARILGIKNVYFLGFVDGTLCNNLYHQVADAIKTHLDVIKPEILLTQEPRGVSGHIDHIVISMVCSYLFEKLSYVKKILYYCISKKRRAWIKDYFIYFPEGYDESEVDEVVDVTDFWDKKIQSIKAHASQSEDVRMMLEYHKNLAKEEFFLVKSK